MDSRVTRRTFTVAGALAVAGCVSPGPGDGNLVVHHLDVGQADATVAQTGEGETIVIDTGFYEQSGQPVIDYLDEEGVDHLDHLVATHPHADHIGGHAEVIHYFEEERDGVGNIYDPGVPHTTWIYDIYMDAVEEFGKEVTPLESGLRVPVEGETQALVLNPPGDTDDLNLNNASVCLRLTNGATGYITTGDAESEAEEWMVSEWGTGLRGNIYQVGHHGSSTSSTEAFVDAIGPDIGVVSSGYDNDYGNPDDEVLTRLGEFDVETYWTGVHKDTTATVDGGVTMEPTESYTTDPLELMKVTPDSEDGPSLASALDVQNGQVTLVVDRIEGGRAVLLQESADGLAGEVAVAPAELPDGATEGSVLSATVEGGSVSDVQVDRLATERRRRTAAERLERLSKSLDDG